MGPNLATVLDHLTRVTVEGRTHRAECPACQHHALTVDDRDGTVLVHCHHGCPNVAVVDALVAVGVPRITFAPANGTNGTRRADPVDRVDATTRRDVADYARARARAYPGSPAAHYAAERFGIDDDAAELAGLGYDPGGRDVDRPAACRHFWHGRALIVPFRTPAGELVGLQRRQFDPDPGKRLRWASPAGRGWGQAGVFGWTDDGPTILTEGPSDALAVYGAGIPAIFTRGVGNGTGADADRLAELVAGWAAGRTLHIAGNADAAGRRFAHDFGRKLAAHRLEVHDLAVPAGINDLADWRAHDPAAFADLLDVALGVAPVIPAPAPVDVPTPGDGAEHFELTDLGNAYRLTRSFGDELRYVPAWQRWLVWDGCRWATDVTGEVHRRAHGIAESLHTAAMMSTDRDERAALLKWHRKSQERSRLDAIVAVGRHMRPFPVELDELDTNPWRYNVRNGTIDLRTGELEAHRRIIPGEGIITKLSPVAWDADATCPRWDRFLAETFAGDDELIGFVQRLCGYAMTGVIREQILPLWWGGGSNGKSTFLSTLLHVWGDYAVAAAPGLLMLATHDQHPTQVADLYGRRLVVAIEAEAGRRLAEVQVKQLTGGDRLKARRMREDFWEFEPTHKLIFAANDRPQVRGTDHAIWRRIVLVPFTVTVPPERQDRELTGKLLAEAPGILRWALDGCLAWQAGGLAVPERVAAVTADYRQSEDHFGRFIDDCLVIGPDGYATARELTDAYRAWCDEQGERPRANGKLRERLEDAGVEYERTKHGRGYRCVTIVTSTTASENTDGFFDH